MSGTLQMDSPVGTLRLTSTEDSLTHVIFVDEPMDGAAQNGDAVPVLVEARRQLQDYFDGTRQEFDLPLAARGSQFQRAVWSELTRIPFGHTVSYGEIARRLGMPAGASRAVGLANGANPIAIIVPCHRVIGANGTLTGYAGGLERKRFLLGLESVSAPQQGLFAQ